MKKEKTDFIDELEKTLSPERVKRAREKAEKAILEIELKQLREKLGVTQKNITTISQSNVSKIESKNDMKISTLIKYIESLGAGLEIKVIPQGKIKKSVTLFRSNSKNEMSKKEVIKTLKKL